MWLGLSAAEWAAIGTCATAVVALAAAAFAYFQVREARRLRLEQSQPYVVVDLQPSSVWSNILNLVVENVGRTVAHDVRFNFEPELRSTQDTRFPLRDSVLVREGIPSMPPGRRIQALFDVSHERKDSNLPMRYDVEVDLRDSAGRDLPTQRYVLDLSYLYGLTEVTEYGMHHAAKALREIEKSIGKWSDIHGRLKVWTRDEDRRSERHQVEEFLTGRYPTMATHRPPEWLMVLFRSGLVRGVIESMPRIHESLQTAVARIMAKTS